MKYEPLQIHKIEGLIVCHKSRIIKSPNLDVLSLFRYFGCKYSALFFQIPIHILVCFHSVKISKYLQQIEVLGCTQN